MGLINLTTSSPNLFFIDKCPQLFPHLSTSFSFSILFLKSALPSSASPFSSQSQAVTIPPPRSIQTKSKLSKIP
ncbi:hypothetical protein PGTUg99_025396 [Puccinia graminis f. sp. tritici]|uniref:Uncharacterized protein n=1 Tax=Puccinia graminis f. sp. tritici TaxID=56615 RepID=A0A5B0QLS0_PUCGR|nr:hypothetical protein PGTUg99_025396 [Puccinia graminis f. sp. tritici]